MPYFRYCDVIYGDMTTALESKLQRAQNFCLRFICRLKKFDHISECYEELNMPRLEQIRRVSLQKLGWKILKREAPTYFWGYFKFLKSRIRSKDLEVPKHRTTQYDRSIRLRFIRESNKLPVNLRNTNTMKAFKKKMETHCFSLSS